ncbi:ABC transporter substrate-binding protein, partial [Burkholderia sp. SIMBA_042]
LMVLNRNGQGITLSNRLADALAEQRTLPKALATLGRKPVFAQTFPTGTHAMWLYYWLASQGVDPLRDIESVVIPPPQM